MERSRNMGAVLMAVSAFQLLIFTLGVLRKSYYAVALPVLGALAAVSAVLFWIGYTMANMEEQMSDLDIADEDEPESFSA